MAWENSGSGRILNHVKHALKAEDIYRQTLQDKILGALNRVSWLIKKNNVLFLNKNSPFRIGFL